MNEELKKCPFCGGDGAIREHRFHGYNSTWGVVCIGECSCETRQFYDTVEEAIEAWNRRTSDAEIY